jgi:alpha-tubulin suppressor-like RCC1 family protein
VGVSVAGSDLTKTAGTAWGNGGAISRQALDLGGYVEWSTGEANTQQMVGLGSGDSSQSYTDIEYALYLNGGTLQVYEAGYYRAALGAYSAADRFRVEVAHGRARYLKNGVVVYSSNANPRYPLVADTAAYTVGATLTDVRIGRMAWRNDVGVSMSGDTLTKTGTAGWNAGAVSTEAIVSGDGWVEFTAVETDKSRICGLARGDGGPGASDVDFGLQLNADATVSVYESGASRGSFGAYGTGDRFRVEVRGGAVRYLQNDAVIYTSLLSPPYPLVADTSLNEPGASLSDVVVSQVIWQDAVGVSVSGATLVNTGPSGWVAGAVSTHEIQAGSGYVEFTAVETTTSRACGLGTGETDQGLGDIDFAISLTSSGAVEVRESGVSRGSFGTYVPGDRFRVEVYAGVVRYRRNGAVLYTSALLPVYPLAVDTSLNETGATIADVQAGSTVWTGELGTAVWGSGLLSTASGWGNAGAVSTAVLASGDGAVEATAQDTVTQQMFGLGFGDASRSYTDIDHGFDLYQGSLRVFESGTYRGAFGTYAAGDRFRVEVAGGTVRYAKNGAVVYTSAVPPQYPLVVDTAATTAGAFLSEVVTSGFSEATKVPAPTFSPAPGAYSPPQSLTLSCALPTAEIRYTTNGAEPDGTSSLYTGPISLTSTTTLKAKAFRTSLAESDTASGTYQMQVVAPYLSPGTGTYSQVVSVTMTSATSAAEIRYTTDGSEPTTSSSLYTAPVGLSLPVTLKAKAFKLGLASTTTVATYSFRVASPSLSPGGGTYFSGQTVTVSCSTPAAVIHYTTSGVDPTEADPIVASGGTIAIGATTTLKARAWRTGWEPSWLSSGTYTLQVATPTFSLPSGAYVGPQSVSVSIPTPGAEIHYSTSGRDPTVFDPAFASGGTVNVASATTLKAKGWKPGYLPSATAQASYFIGLGTVATPTFSPAPGAYASGQSVRIATGTPGAEIRYALGGAEPTPQSPVFGRPLAVSGTTTIKARAYHHDGIPSAVATAVYTIDSGAVASPVLSVGSGFYTTTRIVTVTDATPGAEIHYTTSGADPTPADPVIASGSSITVDRSMIVKAAAWAPSMSPSPVTRRDYVITGAVAAGGEHTLALRADGTVVAWGRNSNGQAGDGTSGNNRLSPVPVGTAGNWLSGVVAVAAGCQHSVALKADGTVVAWGYNLYGQVGDGTSGNNRLTPVPVGTAGSWLTGVVAVAAGCHHSLALKGDGTVVAWGSNVTGEVGDGTLTTPRTTPVPVTGLAGVVAVSAGLNHSMALKSDSTIVAWGANLYGQLGDGSTTTRLTPVPVSGLSGATAIAAGGRHSLALRGRGPLGTMWGWGYGGWGQNGDESFLSRSLPARAFSGAVAIGAGESHSVAIAWDGSAWGLGANGSGQLGRGSFTTREPLPRRTTRLSEPLALAGGSEHTVALMGDGSVWAYGKNAHGQLGDGTGMMRPEPQTVPNLALVSNAWMMEDTDLDGLVNSAEYRLGSDPLDGDSNGDGIGDAAALAGHDVTCPDADGDGVLNVDEIGLGTDPLRADTDGDGSPDGVDCHPLDPARTACGVPDPGDQAPPVITIEEPPGAVPVP